MIDRSSHTIWVERHRPSTLEGYIGNDLVKTKIAEYIEKQDIPHLFFHGRAGTGKTSLAKILVNNIDCDYLFINASSENNVDTVRNKITNFASTMSFKPLKIIVLDECLDKDTLVTVIRAGKMQEIAISCLDDKEDLVKSWNTEKNRIEWMSFELIDKGVQDTIEIQFENGEVVICTGNHKWYVKENDEEFIVKAKDLHKYMHISSPPQGVEMQKIKIKSITKFVTQRHVYDLQVHGNHNFFITKSSILTHNCDYITPNAQAALRNLMEAFSAHTRFILTANYKERVIDPIISRTQSFDLFPPSKPDVARHLAWILDQENVSYDLKDLAVLIHAYYPDIRKIINTTQLQTSDNVLKIDLHQIEENDYKTKVLSILSNTGSVKEKFTNIRQTIADAKITDFSDLYRMLFDKVDEYGKSSISAIILAISEAAYRENMVVDKEINVIAMIVNILHEMARSKGV